MTSSNPKGKGSTALGALTDFLILVLLVGGAGFGGYYWGTTQRMAPVQLVPPGTPGAISADKTQVSPPISTTKTQDNKAAANNVPHNTAPATPPTTNTQQPSTKTEDTKPAAADTHKKTGPTKYWVVSSGSDYIGYSITVKVNGTAVDSFFGPGKTMNVTHLVKAGENDITFDAKNLGAKYNKHKGDEKSVLTLQLVSGPVVQEEFDASAVLATCTRNASEEQDYNETEHFVKE